MATAINVGEMMAEVAPSLMPGGFKAIMHVQDQKTNGTDGGTFTNGDWRTRTLNTVVTNQITGASLASNQVTLAAGNYFVQCYVPAYNVNTHQARLYNVTDGAVEFYGMSAAASTDLLSSNGYSYSLVVGALLLASEKDLEIQHRCQTSNTGDGFGVATSFATGQEIYTNMLIWEMF